MAFGIIYRSKFPGRAGGLLARMDAGSRSINNVSHELIMNFDHNLWQPLSRAFLSVHLDCCHAHSRCNLNFPFIFFSGFLCFCWPWKSWVFWHSGARENFDAKKMQMVGKLCVLGGSTFTLFPLISTKKKTKMCKDIYIMCESVYVFINFQ